MHFTTLHLPLNYISGPDFDSLYGGEGIGLYLGTSKLWQQEGTALVAMNGRNSWLEFATHIDEFSCLNQLTFRVPYKVHSSSYGCFWTFLGRYIGNELIVHRQLFVGRA